MWVVFVTCGALSYVDGICQIWGAGFVISGWDLSYVGGFVIYGYKVIFATYFITVPE